MPGVLISVKFNYFFIKKSNLRDSSAENLLVKGRNPSVNFKEIATEA